MDAVSPHADIPVVWDIVQVDFPFADRAAVRRRPALILAVAHVHAEFSLLWLAMITRATGGSWPFDVPISDLKSGGLLRPCVVRISKIASVDARLVSRIGMLGAADRPVITGTLRILLGHAVAV